MWRTVVVSKRKRKRMRQLPREGEEEFFNRLRMMKDHLKMVRAVKAHQRKKEEQALKSPVVKTVKRQQQGSRVSRR